MVIFGVLLQLKEYSEFAWSRRNIVIKHTCIHAKEGLRVDIHVVNLHVFIWGFVYGLHNITLSPKATQ